MTNRDPYSADWAADRRGVGDPEMLAQLAELVDIPRRPGSTWRAASVTMFATDPFNITSGYLQHIQDLDWPIPEADLLRLTIRLLQHRVDGTTPS